MAKLNPADFYAKWNPMFADNVVGTISEAYMRAFMTDIKDSFLNLDIYPTDVADALAKSHEHTSSLANIEDAVSKKHAHTSSLANIDDAVSKRHAHNQALENNSDVHFNSVDAKTKYEVHGVQVVSTRHPSQDDAVADRIVDLSASTGTEDQSGALVSIADADIDNNFATVQWCLNKANEQIAALTVVVNHLLEMSVHHGLKEPV